MLFWGLDLGLGLALAKFSYAARSDALELYGLALVTCVPHSFNDGPLIDWIPHDPGNMNVFSKQLWK